MAKAAKKEVAAGKIDLDAMRKSINKKVGHKVAFDLNGDEDPAHINYWISTGSTWLDAIICRGQMAGIPGGRITEIAGLPSTGKSYMAMQLIANAQKMGLYPIYGDPEDSLDKTFMARAGVDLNNILYIQPPDLETWLQIMEDAMANNPGAKFLFILDSLAATPTKSDVKGSYDPNSSVGKKARVLSLAFQKLRPMFAETDSTFVILNQLKTNISGLAEVPNPKYASITQKYTVPGGKAPEFWASLRIWLTSSTSTKQNVYDKNNFRIGSYVKARLIKSRFGTQDRWAEFKILWGDKVGVMDEESLLNAIKGSESIKTGTWNTLFNKDGTELAKWQKLEEGFVKHMNETPGFRERVMEIVDEEIIMKFEKREGDGSAFIDDGVGEDIQTG